LYHKPHNPLFLFVIVPMPILLKRAYDPPGPQDGFRILVDRLWPRGLAKADAQIDLWAKDVAPSPSLRQWFDHDPVRWKEFRRLYEAELGQNHEAVAALREQIGDRTATLVYGAKDSEHTHAIILKRALDQLAETQPSEN
jgi:uncharacterized protein YeaO (DUF488 family)